MSIKRLSLLFIAVFIPIAVFVCITAFRLFNNERETEKAQIHRYESYKLAEELLRSSEALTRLARTYAVTSDTKYLRLFKKVLAIRNGELTLPESYGPVYWHLVTSGDLPEPQQQGGTTMEQRLLNAGITLKEFSLLKDAENRSNTLVTVEQQSFDLMEQFNNGINKNQNTSFQQQAITMLHDSTYFSAKASIMKPIGEFFSLLDNRTNKELNDLNSNSKSLLALLVTGTTLLLLLFILFAFLIYSTLIKRGGKILSTVQLIAKGNLEVRTNDHKMDELGQLSNAIDIMADRIAGTVNEAKQETSDALAKADNLEQEKEHSEKLLHNILPVLIADRLKKGESNIAETFPEVTVLFADIVGFTTLSERMAPRQLVNMLNDIFGRFDELAVQFKLEKIKTIGDCYMVVGGVPERSSTHCQQVADFAMAAISSIKGYAAENNIDLHIRVGIHTGTVVAGVVGKQKYSYDLWGDVVNTASRMESAGTADKIHVTEAVKIRLADDYQLEERGTVELKGKGAVKSYYLLSKKH
jgi:class 3 adenylate cyclase/HAMP domain-containing protein